MSSFLMLWQMNPVQHPLLIQDYANQICELKQQPSSPTDAGKDGLLIGKYFHYANP
jgi:hypothetical protein